MKRAVSVLSSSVLFGCTVFASAPGMPPFEGTSALDDRLKHDGFATAYASARAKGCSEIDRVVVGGFPLASSQTLVMTERWVLHGCGETYPFWVNVSGDGEGGAVVDVQEDF
jgi:hypothetical protein